MKTKNQTIVNNYETLCKRSDIDIITSGRYFFNSVGYVGYLATDISKKLDLSKNDSLIDVGCNVGIYHKELKEKAGYILGIDAGDGIIGRARTCNIYSNVEYRTFDVLNDDWKLIDRKFNKALVYSVIHFFDSIDDVEKLLTELLQIMDRRCIILLGEVRDKQLYYEYQESKKKHRITLRNIKFMVNKMINSIYLNRGETDQVSGVPCTVYDFEEIHGVADKLGLDCDMIRQSNKHPFHNTCVDYILKRR